MVRGYEVEIFCDSSSSSDEIDQISLTRAPQVQYSALSRYISDCFVEDRGGFSTMDTRDEVSRRRFGPKRTGLSRKMGLRPALAQFSSRKSLPNSHRVDSRPHSQAPLHESMSSSNDTVFLQRLRTHLTNMKPRENGSSLEFASKQKRKFTKSTAERLMAPNASMRAKMQQKYLGPVDREVDNKSKPTKASSIVQKAGERLYFHAKTQKKVNEQIREETVNRRKRMEEEVCTFKPKISDYAVRLGLSRGPRTLEHHLERYRHHKEELQKKRLEQQLTRMRACSFCPKLCKETERILGKIRCHRGRYPADASASDVSRAAERLYRDGAERLLRSQINLHAARLKTAAHVIGGRQKLSRQKLSQVLARLEAWQLARKRRLAERSGEGEKHNHDRPPLVTVPADTNAWPPHHTRAQSALALPRPSRSGTRSPFSGKVPVPSKHSMPYGYDDSDYDRDRVEASGVGSSDLTDTVIVSVLSTPDTSVVDGVAECSRKQALYVEMRRIRIGALFYKYAPTSQTETISVRDVEKKVRLLYPEDVGVLQALRVFVKSDEMPLKKLQFIDVLERFEQLYGPQEWGRTEKDKILFPDLSFPTESLRPTTRSVRNGLHQEPFDVAPSRGP